MSHKYYIAFKLQPDVHQRVAAIVENYCSRRSPLEPVPLDRLHVTTLFLGDVPYDHAHTILVNSLVGVLTPFDVFVGAPGDFNGRILYLEIIETLGHLATIRSRQYNEYARLIGKNPWPTVYQPHLTLAKVEPLGSYSEKHVAADAIDFAKFKIGPGPEAWSPVTSMGIYEKSDCLFEVDFARSPRCRICGAPTVNTVVCNSLECIDKHVGAQAALAERHQ